METLTIAQTARHLGLSDSGVRKAIERQELFILPGTSPVKLNAEAVETARLLRREVLLAELASRRQTPVTLAREARRVLFPSAPGVNLPQHAAEDQRRRLSLVPNEARQLFGVASLTAACTEAGCRWCTAQKFAEVLGGWAPDAYSEGFAALFDQAPCERCGPRLHGTAMAALAARVHPGGERRSGGRTEGAAPVMRAEPRPAARRASGPARPVQGDDGGKAAIQRRRREVQARLKAANRAGDRAYAEQLVRQMEALRADAAVVDGRQSLKSRPGRLRCGHLLAASCACPRVASRRATS
jgi:hypothetical protein